MTESRYPAAVEKPDAMLALRGVGKRVGRRWLLRGVDLDLQPGESLALVGENGAGKSTLVRMIAGVEGMDEGTVEARGKS